MTRTQPTANQTNASVKTTTTTQYDALGRPIDIRYSTPWSGGTYSPERQFFYDKTPDGHVNQGYSAGLLTGGSTITSPNNAVSRYGYDIMGNINTSFDCLPGWCSQLGTRTMNRSYTYDNAGNKATETSVYGMSNGTNGPSDTLTYTYNAANELDSISGGLNDPAQPKFPHLYQAGPHTPFGTLNEQFGNGLQRNSIFDAMGRDAGKFVCRGTVQPDCGGASGYVYGYRDNVRGNQVSHLEDTATGLYSNMQYDDEGRMASLSASNGLQMTWYYDPYGNRFWQTGGGGGVNVPGPHVGIDPYTNHINNATGYSYDAAGNLITDSMHTYTFDAEGNIVLVDGGTTASDVFDAFNRRAMHTTPNQVERYERNASGQVTDVWNGEAQYEQTERFYANGQNFAYWSDVNNTPSAGTEHFQHSDYTGTVRLVTGSTGNVESSYFSLPYGDAYSASGTDNNKAHFADLDRDAEPATMKPPYGRTRPPTDAGSVPILMLAASTRITRRASIGIPTR